MHTDGFTALNLIKNRSKAILLKDLIHPVRKGKGISHLILHICKIFLRLKIAGKICRLLLQYHRIKIAAILLVFQTFSPKQLPPDPVHWSHKPVCYGIQFFTCSPLIINAEAPQHDRSCILPACILRYIIKFHFTAHFLQLQIQCILKHLIPKAACHSDYVHDSLRSFRFTLPLGSIRTIPSV